MDSTVPLFTIVIAAVLVSFAAMAEVALAAASRQRVRAMLDAGQSRAQAAQALLDEPERFLSTLLVLKTLAVLAAGGATIQLARTLSSRWEASLLAFLLVATLLLILQ